MTQQNDIEWQRQYLAEHGLYDPSEEHSSCGVGLIASTDGRARRDVVSKGIDALKVLFHRGAVDADGKTGDGAGIHVEIPQAFFHEHVHDTGHHPKEDSTIAVGMVFLPRTDMADQEACRTIVEAEILKSGYKIYGWRQVPVNTSVIGDKARSTRPEIEQIMIAGHPGESDADFERTLYVIRRRIEKRVIEQQLRGFYICSLSCRSIIYKGLFLAEQLSVFYPDLLDKRFESRFAIYHQRYSTNTFPEWWLAQPFRSLAHNGEINTIRGNKNWMKVHEIKMADNAFDEFSGDIKPVIPVGASDSAALDAVFELLVHGGRDAPMVKTMLIPESWSKKSTMPEAWRDMYAFVNSVMEPWDGPAAIAATDGRWIVGGTDRNGLRPMRYTLTRDNLLIVGSETGMVVVPETNVAERGRLGPGQMITVDLEKGGFFRDTEIKDRLASERPYKKWIKNFKSWKDLRSPSDQEKRLYAREELRRRQVAAGMTMEDLELILHPQAEDGKEAIGSMGDDTPLAVISSNRRNLSHFFRQNFSQVTNPPVDPLREHRVMSLKTRFGNFANVLDQDADQTGVLVVDSPVITNNEWSILQRHFGETATIIDCTLPADGSKSALYHALQRIREEAETAVRAGKGQLFLTDEHISPERCA
ncbi:MAG: glutamate synthase central domain-containing protein, partial [Pseudomonadota bacterium]